MSKLNQNKLRISRVNKKITFFTQLYYPDATTTAIIMNTLAEDIAAYGMSIKVVCAQPTYIGNGKCRKNENQNRVAIRRVWTFLFDKNKMLGRMLNGSSCFLSMLLRLFFIQTDDLLVFNTNPALLPCLGFIFSKLRGQRYVVLIHDLWPELPANTGAIRNGGLLYKLIDIINNLSLKNASGIIVLSETMKRRVLYKVPGMENKIHIIPNWADSNKVYPVASEKNKLLEDYGLKNKKVVMYSGNIGRYQPMEVMINAANELKNRDDIVFVFAGNGGKKIKLQKMTKALHLKNIMFIPFQPLDRLAESLSMADITLMGIYPENEGVIMPSKLYGLLAIGKPIICVSHIESEVVKILKKAKAGIHSSIDDPKALAQKIVAILDDEEKALGMGKNGRKYFLKHFERKIITKQWKNMLENIS